MRDARVSIHAPHAGRDPLFGLDDLLHFVSIHAPHAGRDRFTSLVSFDH